MNTKKIIHIKKVSHKFKGRGTDKNPANRFEKIEYIAEPEETYSDKRPRTEYFNDTSRSIISFNDSPDVHNSATLNIYRGCEHGCIYCYARPTHEYLSLSAGLDFETKIFVKHSAPELLYNKLSSKGWKPQPVTMSGNTDPYQPIEKKLELTRRCLEVMEQFRNPVNIVTKSTLVTRDIDILSKMNEYNAISVYLSITSLDNRLASVMEPQTSKPHMKLEAIKQLANANIPVGVMVSPVIPGLTDQEIPEILKKCAEAGAKYAGYVMLRLPHGVKDLFLNWLEEYFPDRKQKVVNRLTDLFGDNLYDSTFGVRGRGKGVFADQIKNLFNISCSKNGINQKPLSLSTNSFKNPENRQFNLFE